MIYRYVHLVEIQFYSPINISLLEIHYGQYCVMVTYILRFYLQAHQPRILNPASIMVLTKGIQMKVLAEVEHPIW